MPQSEQDVLSNLLDPKFFIESCLSIVDKDSHKVPFRWRKAFKKWWDNHTNDDFIIKARKMGFSAGISALWLHACIFNQNERVVMVSHEESATKRLLERVRYYISTCEIPIKTKVNSANEISFPDTNSTFWIGTAGQRAFGRGDDITKLHLCLHGDTLIHGANGFITPIKDFKGNVRTHRNIIAKSENSITPAERLKHKGRTLKITAWGNTAFPLICSPDHKIYVAESPMETKRKYGKWVAAEDLKVGKHWIGIPRRHYKSKKFSMPMSPAIEKKRKPKIETLEMDYGLGYLMGVYLAEGTISKNGDNPSAILLSLDKSEGWIINKVRERIGGLANITIKQCKTSRTMIARIYNASLARTVLEYMGEKTNKKIPDIFFRAPRFFLDGLVQGYLDGDGHYAPKSNDIYVSSICPQILVQLRDLLVAMYFGYSSLHRRPAGKWYGRNCKEIYTLCISGRTARKFREYYKIDTFNCRKGGAHWKYDINYIWLPIKNIEQGPIVDKMYDLVLAHSDHSYRTISATVHNSEICFYPNMEIVTGVKEAMRNNGLVVRESTANGAGTPSHKLWLRSVEKKNSIYPHFFGWYEDEEYCSPNNTPFELTPEETELKKSLNLSWGQLRWRREKINSMDDPTLFVQEYPSSWEEAFVTSGQMVFKWQDIKRQEAGISPLKWHGDIVNNGGNIVVNPNSRGSFKVWRTARAQA